MTLTETESFIGLVVAVVGEGGLEGKEEDVTGRSFYKADRI